ncbi:MAG: hypothetical protein ACFFCM_09410 [Promethearchaeota archaeon]
MGLEPIFHSDKIEFVDYDFLPASVYPNKKIDAKEILEVDINQAPPTLRIKNELIFISAVKSNELEAFAQKNNIKIIKRFDIWHSILEPFLDTQFSEAQQQETLQNLKKFGLKKDEVQKLRERVKDPMIDYNYKSLMWDWAHLGQFDLLEAHKYTLNEDEFKKLYWESMKIALLAYKD